MTRASLHSHDRLGLTGEWYSVPKSAQRPESAVQADLEEVRVKVMYVQQRWADNKTGWPLKRRDQEAKSDTTSTEA